MKYHLACRAHHWVAALLLCSLLPLSASAQTATAASAASGVSQFTLANGMTLIVKPDRRAPTAVHMLWVRVGSIDEVDGTSGVAHVLEHMLFKGTPDLKPGEFSRQVAALGGRENAFTSKDYTGYYQQVPAQRVENVMKLEADRFARNQWADAEFIKEIEVVKEERRLRTEDNPQARLYEALLATAFTASPVRRPIVGWMSDLDAMTPDDARAFYQRWYVPANAAVVVAGDVDVAQVKAWADQYYGAIAARALPLRKPRAEPLQAGLRRLDFKAVAKQAQVLLAFKVPGEVNLQAAPGTPAHQQTQDALALTVLASVLDGYSGARLPRALTQGPARLADRVDASHQLIGRGPKLFTLEAVPIEGKTTGQVEAALRQQITKLAAEGVSEAELKRVKTQWIANETYKLDSVMNQARELGIYWIAGLPPDGARELVVRLRAVTAQQVQSVAARYFGDDQLTVATLIPQAAAAPGLPGGLSNTPLVVRPTLAAPAALRP
ncbi:MAG: M16 family metallopeptidase [Burkholderiales bacterium]